MSSPIHVYSEIGKLKTVMLHRPGKELENLAPDILHRMLIDDIPYLKIAQEEHDAFAHVLRQQGIKVLYLEDLLAESLTDEKVRRAFLDQLLDESSIKKQDPLHQLLLNYLQELLTKEMVKTVIAGIRKSAIHNSTPSLADLAEDPDYPFYLDPMPNVYFTRDQQAAIGSGMTINRMTFRARRRESLFMETILKNHPDFKNATIPVWRDRYHHGRLEGGDELVLNNHVLAVGISQRTSATAITDLAHNLFDHSSYDTILAIKIPHNHAMMHLDTVFTMINYNQFTVHPFILDKAGKIDIYVLQPDDHNGVKITEKNDLVQVLKENLHLSELDLIPTGGGDPIAAPREQWNDGSNTLAIAPGEVVTYDRNYVSNDLLRKHGIIVHEIRSSELSRGRGGPRCMSCPLIREDL
ncbi:arginine deiminase [Lactobacillus crispatus]|jgi:arginine deiminase|uniref:Arginine deiminase n=2 Tax=Lactobacillus crispatus TaxID=47770 RepID=A0A109DJQ1_9LACO|nr:arginine deiminase [Lactobacillus crispatus]STX17972.1 arginine deiminase [Lactobacillus acidophilus]AZR15637.1 arginine deiminase [Lactobacillus crispatus]EEJ69225.1 arginine deiminase [Lactobacillus crispatus JV-V01]EEU19942.1 arginine deiminase [Lactobacillus crispatus 125-2-CHN]EEU28412.1 arginine deiminase [Lactobacillus crispatus MV-1A-US]